MKKTPFFKSILFAALSISLVACSSDDDSGSVIPPDNNSKVYALGIGVSTTTATTNYVLQTSDLMNGTISVVGNGILQDGYRDYAFGGGNFYSIGGLGITDVNTISLNNDNELQTTTGLTFELANNDFIDDGSGETMVGLSIPISPSEGLNAKFYTVDIASNTISEKGEVAMNDIHPSDQDWFFHSGMQIRGNQLFQTFYPANYSTYATTNTDTNYVAVYSYPGFELEKVITDTRTGPSGSFNTRSGIFKSENGDLFTVSTSSFNNGYSQSTKPAGILKISAGATEFDEDYFFNTDTAPNGGKIAHAIYIGDGKLFAAVTVVEPTLETIWSDANLKLSIVDLYAQTITPIENTPVFNGDGGRSFAALLEGDKIYTSAKDSNGVNYIYQVDINTATAIQGAKIEGTFLGGIARMK